jgi:hypothetical protein
LFFESHGGCGCDIDASVDKSNVNFDNVHEDGHKNEE